MSDKMNKTKFGRNVQPNNRIENYTLKSYDNRKHDVESLTEDIRALREELSEKDKYVGNVVELCNDRLKQIESKDIEIVSLKAQVVSKSNELDKLRKSMSWRLIKPIRKSIGLLKRIFNSKTPCRLLLLSGALPNGDGEYNWDALDEDTQFLIQPSHKGVLKRSELWLIFDLRSELDPEKLIVEVFFDVGFGFNQALSLKYKVSPGKIILHCSVPKGCRRIRLDPVNQLGKFYISEVFIKSRTVYPCHKPINIGLMKYLRNYGRLILAHEPVNQIASCNGPAGQWVSTGNDPYFYLPVNSFYMGWNLFFLKFNCPDSRYLTVKIYFDYGDGFNEINCEIIRIKSGCLKKRIIRLSNRPEKIRMDPAEFECSFSIEELSVKNISSFYAKKLISNKLVSRSRKVQSDLYSDYEVYRSLFSGEVKGFSYEEWIETVEAPMFSNEEDISQSISSFSYKPLISIVMPTYNTDIKMLKACVDSVLSQYYPFFELCVADDCSSNEMVRDVLSKYALRDSRVRTVFRKENGHISIATNSALEIAKGEFVALLDHDDALAPFALFEVVEALNENPDLNIIYSDEDKIDELGNRFDPHFKSGWNPDLLFSQNYISHLGVYRKSIVSAVGGFRKGVEGSQDYDLLLRVAKKVNMEGIHHIPHILYHWRAVDGSTALDPSEKSYTTQAGLKALENFFSDTPNTRIDTGFLPNTYRVIWPIPERLPLVSLIIPTRNGKEITKQAIDSILEITDYDNYEILLVDNDSDDIETLEYFHQIESNEKVKVLRYPYPFNYSAINNFAAEYASGEIIGLINNDVEVINPGWLTELVRHAIRPEIGCVGAKLYYSNGQIQHAGVILGIGGVAGHSHKYFQRTESGYFGRLKLVQNFSAVTAAVLLVRKKVFKEVGGLDEENLKVAFNDVDFCLRVQEAGYRNLWSPYAELYHHESISRGAEDNPQKIARFNKEIDYMRGRWSEVLDNDNFYNENLSLEKEDFSLRRLQKV